MTEDGGVPADVREETARLHEQVYLPVIDGLHSLAVTPAKRVLECLQPYRQADQVHAFRVEKAWAYFAIGMDARSAGRFDEAAAALTKVVELLLPTDGANLLSLEALNQLAILRASQGDKQATAEIYRQLLDTIGKSSLSIKQGVFWLGYGEALERLDSPGGCSEAVRAYSRALHYEAIEGNPADWAHRAYEGLMRCCPSTRRGEIQPFWSLWLRGSRQVPFWLLSATSALLYVVAVGYGIDGDAPRATLLAGLGLLPFVVVLLPSLRSVSGPGWSVEMRDGSAAPGLGVALRQEDARL